MSHATVKMANDAVGDMGRSGQDDWVPLTIIKCGTVV